MLKSLVFTRSRSNVTSFKEKQIVVQKELFLVNNYKNYPRSITLHVLYKITYILNFICSIVLQHNFTLTRRFTKSYIKDVTK